MATTTVQIAESPDGISLRTKLKLAERRRKITALTVVLPVLLFVLVGFIFSVGRMMFNAIHDDTLLTQMPHTMGDKRVRRQRRT